IRGFTCLLDQLVGRVRATRADDARAELLALGLPEDERDPRYRGRPVEGVAARGLALRGRRRATGARPVPRLVDADLQALGSCGFRPVRLVVFDDELDLLAEHAARTVDRFLGELGPLGDVVARGGEGAGQRLSHADLDGVLRCGGSTEEQGAKSRTCGGEGESE